MYWKDIELILCSPKFRQTGGRKYKVGTIWSVIPYEGTIWSVIQTLHLFANLLPNWTLIPILTLLPNFGGFHRTLQRVRLANRGRLLLRTPGPVPFGTCICSNVETILSWTCHVYGPFEFRTSLGTSILLQTYLYIWLARKIMLIQRYKTCLIVRREQVESCSYELGTEWQGSLRIVERRGVGEASQSTITLGVATRKVNYICCTQTCQTWK